MTFLPMRTTREKLPTSNRRDTAINANFIILLVKITFVLLICGSSYLAGSLWGKHSLELRHDASLSVGSLFNDSPRSDRDVDDPECEDARKKWIELRVLEGKVGHCCYSSMFSLLMLFLKQQLPTSQSYKNTKIKCSP